MSGKGPPSCLFLSEECILVSDLLRTICICFAVAPIEHLLQKSGSSTSTYALTLFWRKRVVFACLETIFVETETACSRPMNHECVLWFFWVRSFQCPPQRSFWLGLRCTTLIFRPCPKATDPPLPTAPPCPNVWTAVIGISFGGKDDVSFTCDYLRVSQYVCRFQIKEGRKARRRIKLVAHMAVLKIKR